MNPPVGRILRSYTLYCLSVLFLLPRTPCMWVELCFQKRDVEVLTLSTCEFDLSVK